MANDTELLSSIQNLTEQQKQLLEKIEQRQTKDSWDRFSTLSTFLSTVIIAAIGLYFTNSYNHAEANRKAAADVIEQQQKEQASRMLEMQTVERFFPHLTSVNQKEKDAALLTLSTLAEPTFAAKLGDLLKSPGAVDTIMKEGSSKTQSQSPGVVTQAGTSRVGWAYLGNFVGQTDTWQTQYFDFDGSLTPEALVGKQLRVKTITGDVNVRQNMPTPEGDFPPVINVLRPGTPVTVNEVHPWSSSGFTWAKIAY